MQVEIGSAQVGDRRGLRIKFHRAFQRLDTVLIASHRHVNYAKVSKADLVLWLQLRYLLEVLQCLVIASRLSICVSQSILVHPIIRVEFNRLFQRANGLLFLPGSQVRAA